MTLLVDILLVVCFLLTMIAGLRNGFFRELCSLLGVALGTVAGLRYTRVVYLKLPASLQHFPTVANALVFVLIFMLAFVVLSLVGRAFAALWEGKKPSSLSRMLGLVLGGLRGLVLVLFLAGAMSFLAEQGSPTLGRSRVLPLLSPGVVWGAETLGGETGQRLLRKWKALPFHRAPKGRQVQESPRGSDFLLPV